MKGSLYCLGDSCGTVESVKGASSKVKQVASTVSKTANKAAKAARNAIAQAGKFIASNVSDDAQLVLDVIGLVPVVGELADGANAVIYAAKGDYANAALSAAAMLPVGGQAATGAKLGYKGLTAMSGNAVFGGMDYATKAMTNFSEEPSSGHVRRDWTRDAALTWRAVREGDR